MKRIFGIVLVWAFSSQINAQTSPDPAGSSKVLTVAEANALNGTAMPTINGKPYSQYKAEQEALKRQKQAQQPAQPVQDASVTVVRSSGVVPAPAKAEPVQKTSDNETIDIKPAVTSSEIVAVQPSVKGTSADPEANKPVSIARPDNLSNGPEADPSKPGSIKPEPAKAPVQKRTAAEIEKANQQQAAAAKVQPSKTDVPSTTERPAETKTQPGQRD